MAPRHATGRPPAAPFGGKSLDRAGGSTMALLMRPWWHLNPVVDRDPAGS